MSLEKLIKPFCWTKYSKKLQEKIDKLRYAGYFSQEEALARNVFFAEGEAGSCEEGNYIHLYWLVDKEDGVIIDARFQAFGQSALIGAAEIASELLMRKNYDQASRFSTPLIDQSVRDRSDLPAFPTETSPHIELVIEAIVAAAHQCNGLPLPTQYIAPPIPELKREGAVEGYPHWLEISPEQQQQIIENVLDQDLRPYIALDGGGIEIVRLVQGTELTISYQGSCTSCYSSIGTTLSYIQQTLRTRIHPSITVIPDLP
jgi:NifU-like protein